MKARWALHYHGLGDYEYTEYTPKASEPWLRWKTGKWSGHLTVPVLFVNNPSQQQQQQQQQQILFDSYHIAEFADRNSRNGAPSLFPDELKEEIAQWNMRSDEMLASGRTLSMIRATNDIEAVMESLPGWMNRVGWLGRFTANSVVQYFLKKYPTDPQQDEAIIRKNLNLIRDRLKSGKGEYLLQDRFTYADIVAASALQVVSPVSEKFWQIKPGSRRLSTSANLSAEFPDVLAWRDQLFERHFWNRNDVTSEINNNSNSNE